MNRTHKHLLHLAIRDANEKGWCKVSSAVWNLIEQIPSELVEKDVEGGFVRVTKEGKIALKWSD